MVPLTAWWAGLGFTYRGGIPWFHGPILGAGMLTRPQNHASEADHPFGRRTPGRRGTEKMTRPKAKRERERARTVRLHALLRRVPAGKTQRESTLENNALPDTCQKRGWCCAPENAQSGRRHSFRAWRLLLLCSLPGPRRAGLTPTFSSARAPRTRARVRLRVFFPFGRTRRHPLPFSRSRGRGC